MKGDRVRSEFLGFFEQRGHERVKSSSLIPPGDATLLFSNAGMNQFKDVFLGRESRALKRATSCQKCLRVSGKHNDFDQVGRTARHQTFFEMLGNFSFGDYFKEEAIAYAWELVTRVYGLPAERLWVTVFREDEDAATHWRRVSALPADRITRLGEKDNFWAMGETGPCGPCSEIYFDQGSGVGCGRPECGPDCGCDRYLEFWNLVFMQYDRLPDGSLLPLAAPSIDTGAGLERLTAILQGVDSNYKTDLFMPLIEAIAQRCGKPYGQESAVDVGLQVIADHLRAVTFLIGDGVVPSNEKRGYILRRIIRRALAHGLNLDLSPPYLFDLTGRVVDMMVVAYPELPGQRARVAEVCRREEETFQASLQRGIEEANAAFERYKGGLLPAGVSASLWTTYGVTQEIQQVLARNWNITFPMQADLEVEMEKHRETARASWKGGEAARYPRDLLEGPGASRAPSEFLGYDTLVVPDATISALAGEAGLADRLEEGQRGFVVLDRTPFYAEAGGQVGDTGRLVALDGSEAEVEDTQAPAPGRIVHRVRVLNGSLHKGEAVRAEVDARARAATMRNHTATHLLHAALKKVLGPEVQQAGSYVGPDRLRFDFNYPRQVDREALDRVEDEVNEQILRNAQVSKVEKGFEEALAGGAIALFGEKYGGRVRVVSVPGYSQELCGGTHCTGTGDIGYMKIVGERGIAAGVRRIEALTGMAAALRAREDRKILADLEPLLRAPREGLQEAIVNALATQKAQARELEKLRLRLAQLEMQSASPDSGKGTGFEQVEGVKLVARRVEGLDRSGMRNLADNLKREMGTGVVILAAETAGKVSVLTAITQDLTGRLDARAVIKDLAALVGGGGGGNAQMAEAGGRDPEKIPEMIGKAREILSRHLTAQSQQAEP